MAVAPSASPTNGELFSIGSGCSPKFLIHFHSFCQSVQGWGGIRPKQTMSGRLIILPKKSYNPWKPENVERVLRDERLERERQAQLEDADRKKQSEDRVELLKKRKRDGGSNDDGRSDCGGADHTVSGEDAALEHVNLFADEEKAMMEKAVAGAQGSASEADKKKKVSSSSGVMPVYLGGEEAARRRGDKALPFYLQPSSQDEAHGGSGDGVTGFGSSAQLEEAEAEAVRVRKDERLKTQMDPMHEFCNHSGSGTGNAESHTVPLKDGIEAAGVDDRRRKRHRRKRRDSYSSSSGSSESDSSSSSSNGSSSDEDNDSQRRKRKRHKSRRHDKNRRRDDSKKRSSARSKDGRRRRDKKRSTKRHTKDDTALPSCASTLSIDEMRRRRQLREQKEAERSFMARLEDQSLLKAAGRNHKYQDQYNPDLSRR